MTALSSETDRARQHARAVVRASGTSFAFGMRILPPARRDGMYAVYAFCREVDDIADDDGRTTEDRQRALDEWRAEIDRVYTGDPQTLTGQALLEPIANFNLDKEEFVLVIEGMEMDAHGPIIAPSMETLLEYTRRAAGAVGQLSMPIFGAPQNEVARTFALSLGDALQITNILRDVAEDARNGRLYLPRDLLERYDVPTDPAAIIGAPGLGLVARDLGETVRARFISVRTALETLDWRVLRPALLMMGVYERYFQRLEARGWDKIGTPLSLSKTEKLMLSARYGLFPPLKAAPAFPGVGLPAGGTRG
ncbi:MAG: squalene/phytoene synthase family protein [Pseudomonadota bacterium]